MNPKLIGLLMCASMASPAMAGWIVQNRQGNAGCTSLSPVVGWSGFQAASPQATWFVTEVGQPNPFQLHWQHSSPAINSDRFSWSGEASGYSLRDAQLRELSVIEDLYFSVNEGTPFEVKATMGAGGEVMCRIEELDGVGGGTSRIIASQTLTSTGSHVVKGFLSPGAYRFVSSMSLSIPAGRGDVAVSGSASLIVPAPSSIWLLPASLVVGLKRRHRSAVAL